MVSIIIPLYNRIALFPETVASVLKQTYTDWEAVIIDDGSTDGSYEYALQLSAEDNRFKVIKNVADKKGASSARNTGLQIASNKYIIFLDSDDLLAPLCLQQRIKTMENNASLDFAVFNQETFFSDKKNDNKIFNSYPIKKEDSFLKMFLRNENPWTVTCPVWKKDVLADLNGFDEELIYMEDPDLHVRAMLQGNKFEVYKDMPVDTYYRIGNMDSNKENVFYKNSVLSRIVFFRKMVELILKCDGKFQIEYLAAVRSGYVSLLKYFMLARLALFEAEFNEFSTWLKSRKVLSLSDHIMFSLIGKIFLSKNRLIYFFRIRGLIYKGL